MQGQSVVCQRQALLRLGMNSPRAASSGLSNIHLHMDGSCLAVR